MNDDLDAGEGFVLAVTLGAMVYIVIAALAGWL